MKCLDGNPCSYWFTSDGHCVCRHGLNEKNYADKTGVELCCPLELQLEYENEKWKKFWETKDEIIQNLMVKFRKGGKR